MLKKIDIEEALKKKYPESIALLSCVDKDGKTNLIPLGWTMQTSSEPPMIAVSIGKTRYSHQLVLSTKEFVLCYVGVDMEQDILYCGTHSGRDVDKIKKLGLTTQQAVKVKAPLIEKALVNLECIVVAQIDTGDHTIFAAEIYRAYMSDKEIDKLCILGRMKFGGISI